MKTLSNILAVIAIIAVIGIVITATALFLTLLNVVAINVVLWLILLASCVIIFLVMSYFSLKIGDSYYDPYKKERERNITRSRK